jgi:hypothetical protein
MTIENQIAELLAQAEPLRGLAHDDPAQAPLAGIVDRINALRAEQAAGRIVDAVMEFESVSSPGTSAVLIEARRKPGPKPKAAE